MKDTGVARECHGNPLNSEHITGVCVCVCVMSLTDYILNKLESLKMYIQEVIVILPEATFDLLYCC
jgi:hypothetical protein